MCEPRILIKKKTVKKNSSNLNFGYLMFKYLFLGVLMELFMLFEIHTVILRGKICLGLHLKLVRGREWFGM